MKKVYRRPLIFMLPLYGDVITMSDGNVNVGNTGWGNYDDGGIPWLQD